MTPRAQYTYSDGSANQARPTGMTYPNGREVAYAYGTAGRMDNGLSRLASISDDGNPRASFKYLGLSTPVRTEFTEPKLCQDLWGGTPGQYDGLDPFLRVKDLRWTEGTSDTVRIKHGYDRDSNRLWRENPVAAAASKPQDQLYAYDNLNRLIQMQRGLLNVPHTGLTQKEFEQAWGLDKAGNWSRFRQDDDGGGTWDLDQSRRTNKGNEIVAIGSQSGSAWAAPGHDPTGNMRSFPKPAAPTGSFGAKYDAWNRLVRVTDGEATVAEYAYDGRSLRTKKTTGGTTRHYYYSSGWQVLEERVGTQVERQHVWGLGINSLILRDRDSDGNGSLDERLYALQDAHWDVCAVADAVGNVLERYEYEAYGQPRILTPSFDTRPSSLFAWEVLFQGSARDAETGLYQVRYRYYHPVLGLWLTRDPLFDHWGGQIAGTGYDSCHRSCSARVGWTSRDLIVNAIKKRLESKAHGDGPQSGLLVVASEGIIDIDFPEGELVRRSTKNLQLFCSGNPLSRNDYDGLCAALIEAILIALAVGGVALAVYKINKKKEKLQQVSPLSQEGAACMLDAAAGAVGDGVGGGGGPVSGAIVEEGLKQAFKSCQKKQPCKEIDAETCQWLKELDAE